MTDPLPPEFEAIALKALEKSVKARRDAVGAVVGQSYVAGHRETFRSPISDRKFGLVHRTDPDPVWVVTDGEALTRHLREDPANLEEIIEIEATNEELVALLHEHAPHLLTYVTRVTQQAMADALAAARGGAKIPGIEKLKPDGVLTVLPDKNAPAVLAELIDAKLLTWDGRRTALPAAPAPPEESP